VGNRSLAGWASLGLAFWRLDRMVKRVPIDEPWKADGARAFDAQTLGGWFRSPWNVPSATERKVINTTMTTLFCVDLDEVSLLGSSALGCGGGSFEYHIDSDPRKGCWQIAPAGVW
jgi:monoamine oxidase